MDAATHTPFNLSRRVAVAIVGVAASCLFTLPLGGCSSAPDLEAFQKAFAEQQAALLDGVALNDYVEPSDYSFSFDLSEPETEDGVTSTSGTVTVANESFQTVYTVSGTCEDGEFKFSINQGQTTPIAGVDFDDEHGFGDATSELVGDNACEVTTTQTVETWFATITFDKTYRYEFQNDMVGSYWAFVGESVNSSNVQYKNGALDGSYTFTAGSMTDGSFSTFEITGFAAVDGTFVVNYANGSTSGTAACEIELVELDEGTLANAQADGTAVADAYQFHFSGTSTSDSDTKIEGYLSADDGTIISDSWLPTSSLEVMGYSQEVYGSVSGTLVK